MSHSCCSEFQRKQYFELVRFQATDLHFFFFFFFLFIASSHNHRWIFHFSCHLKDLQGSMEIKLSFVISKARENLCSQTVKEATECDDKERIANGFSAYWKPAFIANSTQCQSFLEEFSLTQSMTQSWSHECQLGKLESISRVDIREFLNFTFKSDNYSCIKYTYSLDSYLQNPRFCIINEKIFFVHEHRHIRHCITESNLDL